jgi:cellulose synthase/poly-beta-1,6-N-acetylglucosamine synthase-like glycosyltransferase
MARKEDDWNDTALHYAASQGCLQSVQVVLAFGADLTARNFAGRTAADLAAAHNFSNIVQFLSSLSSNSIENIKVQKSFYEEKYFSKSEKNGIWELQNGCIKETTMTDGLREIAWEGIGSPGTSMKSSLRILRPLVVLTQLSGAVYIVWRALRSLRSGLGLIYSVAFWFVEFFAFLLSNCFMFALWNQIERSGKNLDDAMPSREDFPGVDVFIVCYSEPVEVIEATTIAAVNMDYPGDKLTVRVLDDGKNNSVKLTVERIQKQAAFMKRNVKIIYCTRDKVAGIPHHAKAGNINNCLLKSPNEMKSDFILVLDCDMIPSPAFLLRTLGHFYERPRHGGEGWAQKPYCAFLQTPQSFWNVDSSDELSNTALSFYHGYLLGRDGSGSCPCVGTGVVFSRSILLSNGGQTYGSVTEDYNTAMSLLASGFGSMYLSEPLVFGLAPDDIVSCFTQRLRWTMGSIQILFASNPLSVPGLSFGQSILFFEAAIQFFLSFGITFMALVPIIYLFTQYSPMVVAHLWEFCVVFGVFYLCNRVTMWWYHHSLALKGSSLEIWRGSQCFVWIAPNHIKAILKVVIAKTPILRQLQFEIGFAVTKKDKETSEGLTVLEIVSVTWPYFLYYIAYIAGVIYFIVTASLGWWSAWEIVIYISALAWGLLISLYIFPPISTLLPRVETDDGWEIVWQPHYDSNEFVKDSQGRLRIKSRSFQSTESKVSRSTFLSRKRSAQLTQRSASIPEGVVYRPFQKPQPEQAIVTSPFADSDDSDIEEVGIGGLALGS